MKQNYTKYPDKQLEDLLKDLKLQLIYSHTTLVEGKKKKYNFKNIKKEIARLLTEIRRRELQNKDEI